MLVLCRIVSGLYQRLRGRDSIKVAFSWIQAREEGREMFTGQTVRTLKRDLSP